MSNSTERNSGVAIISTVKAPLDQLVMFVNYHINLGVDEIILYFDDPEDPCLNVLSRHPNVTAIACSSFYWQENGGTRPTALEEIQILNLNNGAELAKSMRCKWIIHIDSDEILNPNGKLNEILMSSNADVLRFRVMEAVAEKSRYDHIFEPTLFKINANPKRVKLARLLGCFNAIYDGEYFRGHLASKTATRLDADVRQHGIHGPSGFDKTLIRKRTKDIALLHFDCIGMVDWAAKCESRIQTSATTNTDELAPTGNRPNRKNQFWQYVAAKQQGNEALTKLYRKLYIIPRRERLILKALNMLCTVRLDRSLFQDPR